MNGKKSNGIGTIRKRREGLWEARYTAGTDLLTGKQIQKSVYGKTKPEAKKKLTAAIANLPQQEESMPSSSFNFGSWLDKWIKDYCCTRKPNTIEQYEYQIRVNIKPALGKIALSELDGEQIQHLYNTLMKPHKLLSGNGRVLNKEERIMKNIVDELTAYRLKVERDGREILNVPGILALPGVLALPKMSIIGTVAASLLGCEIHLESENGKNVDIGKAVKDATGTVADTTATAAKTVREEIEKAWDELSADDPEGFSVPREGVAGRGRALNIRRERDILSAADVRVRKYAKGDCFQ